VDVDDTASRTFTTTPLVDIVTATVAVAAAAAAAAVAAFG